MVREEEAQMRGWEFEGRRAKDGVIRERGVNRRAGEETMRAIEGVVRYGSIEGGTE